MVYKIFDKLPNVTNMIHCRISLNLDVEIIHRAFQKFSSQICISNESENRIFSICPLYSLGDQFPIYILVYFKRTIIVVPILDFYASV